MYCRRSLVPLLLVAIGVGSLAVASPRAEDTSVAPASPTATPGQRCSAAMASVENARSFRPAEPEPSPRTLLMERFRSAPRVFATGEVKLSTTPAVAWSHFSVSPAEDIRILEDCGDGLVVVAVSRPSTYGPYLEGGYVQRDKLGATPATCDQLQAWVPEALFRPIPPGETSASNVVITPTTVRVGPSATSRGSQLLTYGAPVRVISTACEGWSLIGTAWGMGFVPSGEIAPQLFTELELATKIEQSATDQRPLWTLTRAHYFPSEDNRRAAQVEADKLRQSPPSAKVPCNMYFGECQVLARDSIHRMDELPSDPGVSQIPLLPWWVLPSATAPAEMVFLRVAYVNTTLGDCNCCGCISCQTTLSLQFERLGHPGEAVVSPLGASRTPPGSWFQSVPTDGCKTAEQVAMVSAKWQVPTYGGDATKPARKGEGSCVAGEKGTVWWQEIWHHPELADQESDVVFRSYRISGGKVIATGPLNVSSSTGNTTLTQSTELLYAWRDFDGDGDVEALWRCSYGGYCRQEEQPTR